MVHGGLYGGHKDHNIKWINENIKKPEDTDAGLELDVEMTDNNSDEKELRAIKYQIVQDLLWSDPKTRNGMHHNAHRGQGKTWGSDQSDIFCKANEIEYIVRSHETIMTGWQKTHAGRVHTVFSAANYCGSAGNKGAVLVIEGDDLTPRAKAFDHVGKKPDPVDEIINLSGIGEDKAKKWIDASQRAQSIRKRANEVRDGVQKHIETLVALEQDFRTNQNQLADKRRELEGLKSEATDIRKQLRDKLKFYSTKCGNAKQVSSFNK